MQLLVGFALVGSVLTLVGIYGVLSLSVAARRREIAIRAAVGAGRRDIRNLVFGEGFRLIAGGVISGIAAAIVLSRVLKSFLFEVEPTDPATLIGVGDCYSPASRCWRVGRRRAARRRWIRWKPCDTNERVIPMAGLWPLEPGQNIYRNANCTIRGSPAAWIRPKLRLFNCGIGCPKFT